jgi:Asp-tRNA(Asn)/Glu-tRNA(Gln) amidotransferase A subunit family amidase
MDIEGIDIWISPAATGAAPKGLESTGNPGMNLPWTQARLPTLGLPTGVAANGLPLGTQFTADFGKDEELFVGGKVIEAILETDDLRLHKGSK